MILTAYRSAPGVKLQLRRCPGHPQNGRPAIALCSPVQENTGTDVPTVVYPTYSYTHLDTLLYQQVQTNEKMAARRHEFVSRGRRGR